MYLAPMEGITNYVYRNVFNKYFGKDYVTKYYTPFLVPRGKGKTMREQLEVDLKNNEGMKLIPQVLTDDPKLFVSYAMPLRDMGYDEINFNFGCPSGTVTSKGRGAAILTRKDVMRKLLDAAFTVPEIKISVKTRLGMEDPDEFYELLDLYNEYPIIELIIHARVKKEMYSGRPHVEKFKYALEHSRNPIVYNGDIFSKDDYISLMDECGASEGGFPVMIGRGAIARPRIFREICGNMEHSMEEAWEFISEFEEVNSRILSGEDHLLQRMKEIWTWYIKSFPGNEKNFKKLLKSRHKAEFQEIERQIILGC